MDKKPRLKLVGRDGNAYSLLGAAQRVAKKAGWPPDRVKLMMDEATSGDYDNLLQTLMRHFDVC